MDGGMEGWMDGWDGMDGMDGMDGESEGGIGQAY